MSRPNREGVCRICGEDGKLSWEHIPPECAFNNYPVVRATMSEVLFGNWDGKKGKSLQRGSGGYTLCIRCNQMTGRWYASEYGSWAKQSLEYFDNIDHENDSEIFIRFDGYPLRFLKQIITMHFSTNAPGFAKKHPDLVKFVMDKESRYLPHKYLVDLVLVRGNFHRSTGVCTIMDVNSGKYDVLSEISHRPFSSVVRFVGDNAPLLGRHGPIEGFTDYHYDQRRSIEIKTISGHIAGQIPVDYRSANRKEKDAASAEFEERISRFNNG